MVEVFSGNRLDTAWTNRVSKGMYSLAAYMPGLRVVSQGDKLSERCMMRVINVITLNWMSLRQNPTWRILSCPQYVALYYNKFKTKKIRSMSFYFI